jgi:hypothetical protein
MKILTNTRRILLSLAWTISILSLILFALATSSPTRKNPQFNAVIDKFSEIIRPSGTSKFTTIISINSSLPETVDSPSSRTWTEAISSLEATAELNVRDSLKHLSPIEGIPGTAIESNVEFIQLQQRLDCMSGQGDWKYRTDETGGEVEELLVHKQESIYNSCDRQFAKGKEEKGATNWNVRSSLKWQWLPARHCNTTREMGRLDRFRLCTLLAHKKLLIIGDTPSFSIHDLILDYTTTSPVSDYGDLYCKEHSICGELLKRGPVEMDEEWISDKRVYNDLPPRTKQILSGVEILSDVESRKRKKDEKMRRLKAKRDEMVDSRYSTASSGTLLRFRRSDGLSSHSRPNFIHPSTGILEVNQPFLPDVSRSEIIIITKSPLPLPSRFFTSDWSEWYASVERGGEEGASRMIQAVESITRDVWIPELIETLITMRRKTEGMTGGLLIYRGSWRSHSDCGKSNLGVEGDDGKIPTSRGDGPPPHLQQPDLPSLLFSLRTQFDRSKSSQHDIDMTSNSTLNHLATLFTNLQIILQNHVIRTIILPQFGIPFIDMESSSSVMRSGMVGGSTSKYASLPSAVDQHIFDTSAGLRSAASGDCHRYCLPSPGRFIETTFLGGLMEILETGWGDVDD